MLWPGAPTADAQSRGTTTTTAFVAPESRSITLIPPNIQLDGTPGETVERTISVENSSDVPQNVVTSVRNFKPQEEEGQAAPTTEESTFSMAKWIAVSPNAGTLKPRDRLEFTARIAVPANAEPGSHFGSVVFTPSVSGSPNSGFFTTTEVSTLMLLRVPGPTKQEGSIATFEPEVLGKARGPVNFHIRVSNTGSVHFIPKGDITVTDTFGRTAAVIPVNAENHPVLPGAVRRLDVQWDAGRLIGRYDAKMHLTYPSNVEGEPARSLDASTNFKAVPKELVVAVVLAVVLLFLTIVLRRRRKKARPAGNHFAD